MSAPTESTHKIDSKVEKDIIINEIISKITKDDAIKTTLSNVLIDKAIENPDFSKKLLNRWSKYIISWSIALSTIFAVAVVALSLGGVGHNYRICGNIHTGRG